MSENTSTQPVLERRDPSSSVAGGLIAVACAALAAVACVAVGVRWHATIASWFAADAGIVEPSTRPDAPHRQLWTCGMHPQVIQDHPGDCPICHMQLTPLAQDQEAETHHGGAPMAVTISPTVIQNMGVRVATVTRGPLKQTIRAVGYLAEAQPMVHDVNLHVSGWIEKLYANTEGQHIVEGEPLFDLYSPEIQVAVQELIAARKSGGGDETSRSFVQASRAKLEQWGLDAAEIDRLQSMDDAPRTVTFTSPISGHVTMKNAVEGAAVKAGDRALQIVDHSMLWLDAQVFEQDLPFVHLGQSVTANVDAIPGQVIEGTIVFVHPHVDATTRTATVRMELPNPSLQLRPGMYASMRISSQLGDVVLVPREAVIETGTRSIAFVSKGDGRFEPRDVKLGSSGDAGVEVLNGLAPGDVVVTSGQFLLDSESRTQEAIQRHRDQGLLMSGTNALMPAKGGH